MTPFTRFLREGITLAHAEKGWARKVERFIMIEDKLYRKVYLTPLLKCINHEQGQYVMKELHEGICGYHYGTRTMAMKVLRAGYY